MHLSDEQIKVLQKIGNTLREQREKNGLSYKKVSDITRISVYNLKNIEEANYKNFPSIVFVKGFLRNYGNLLEINHAWMIEELNNIYLKDSSENEELNNPVLLPQTEKLKNNEKNSIPLVPVITLLLLLVLICSGSIYFLLFRDTSGSLFSGNQTTLDITQSDSVSTVRVEENKETEERGDQVFDLSLSLIAKKTGWIRITMDSANTFDVYIETGRSYRWNASEKFEITLGRGDLADIMFNNQPQTIDPALADKMVNLTFQQPTPN